MHTPGPWHLGNAHDCGEGYAICAGAQVLARVAGFGYPIGKGHAPESDANARLMMLAPEMLSALKAINSGSMDCGHNQPRETCWCCGVRVAIAKAYGWEFGGDAPGFWFHTPTWGNWKAAASWAGTNNEPSGPNDRPAIYDSFAEMAEAEDLLS